MHTTHLRKVGGSVMLAIPPAILDLLQLAPGSVVALDVADGRLVVELQRRPRYSLDVLLAQCDAHADLSTEDCAWLDNKPSGEELI